MCIIRTAISEAVRHYCRFKVEIIKQYRNWCIEHVYTSHFQTSDVLTNENMATKKGVCAAVLRWNNWRFV